MAVRHQGGRSGGCLIRRGVVGLALVVGCGSLSPHFFGHTISIQCSPEHCPYRTLVIGIFDVFSST
jgi:hypothetical protein